MKQLSSDKDTSDSGEHDRVMKDENSWETLKPLLKRYWSVLPITWLLHLGLGLSISISGPTLPYLALNTGQSLGQVSIVYTVRSIIVCVTSIGVGLLLGRLSSSRSKLLLLLVGSFLGAGYAFLTPIANSPVTLILAQCLFGIGCGTVDTVNNMLVIFLFGPVLSRSFSHSLHFCVGIGGFLAPVLAQPFLLQMGDISGQTGSQQTDVCGNAKNVSANSSQPDVDLAPLKWPYIIVGSLHSIWIIGYAILLAINFQLVKFQSVGEKQADEQAVTLACFVLFYILHVGQENMFWSHLYSFGICSRRLKMTPADASLLSTIFFSAEPLELSYLDCFLPAKILLFQLTGCFIATVLLAILGESSHLAAYICCGMYGFCIAMVFPTGITWLASKIEVTGSLSSAWFIGAYVGNSTYPLAAGYLIATSATGPVAMMYLAAATSAAYLAVV
uniref:MFS domain-containing protein n=1 Tax=Macrostomum lignano TaxID=282301 RepID=A0A1I8F1G2_9PLAT